MTIIEHDDRVDHRAPPVIQPNLTIEPVEFRTWTSTIDKRQDGKPFSVKYPVFNPDDMTDEAKAKIPKDLVYVDHDDLIYKVLVDLIRGKTPMLWGEPGTGKTVGAEFIAQLMQLPFERIPLGETSEREDITGHHELVPGRTRWVNSRIAHWYGQPCVTTVDESNASPPAVWHTLRSVFDDSGMLTLDSLDGRVLLRHPYNFILATGNPHWTPGNIGIMPLAEADASRLSHIMVDWPSEPVEYEIVARKVLPTYPEITDGYVLSAVRFFNELRKAAMKGDIPFAPGTRDLLSFVTLLAYHTPQSATLKVFGRSDPSDVKAVQLIQKSFVFPHASVPASITKIRRSLVKEGVLLDG